VVGLVQLQSEQMSAFAASLDETVFSQSAVNQLTEDLTNRLTPILCQLKERGRSIRGQEQSNFDELRGRSSMSRV
jgi:hypothetical protein